MKLSTASSKKVSDWVSSKIDHHVCQTCGGEEWAVGDMLALPCPLRSGAAQPVIVLQCAKCACVKLFDAIAVGIDPLRP